MHIDEQMGNESFEYLIADIYNPTNEIPEGLITKTIPAFTAGYCVEMYDAPDKYPNGTQDENYYCEIWIPVKKK